MSRVVREVEMVLLLVILPLIVQVPVPTVTVPLLVIDPVVVGELPRGRVVPLATVMRFVASVLLIVTEAKVTLGASTGPLLLSLKVTVGLAGKVEVLETVRPPPILNVEPVIVREDPALLV